MLELEALKQIFKEQEEHEQSKANTKAEIDRIKAERLELDKRKQAHKERQDRERLKLLQAKEQQQAKQIKKENQIYVFSLMLTFGSILASFILFLVIILKY